MRNINDHIKKKTFSRVYLLCGDEPYLRRQCRDKLVAAMIPEGDAMNLAHFEGKGIDERELMRLSDTMPFFSDYRVIVVEDSGMFASSGHDGLAAYMKEIPETSCLIFSESETDKRNKLYKAVSSAGYIATLNVPPDKQLVTWLAGMIRREDKQIRESTLDYFMSLVAHDMNSLANEMEKLIAYVGERPYIERADVDAVCSVFVENRIFDMIHAVSERDQARALRLYEDLVTLKEPAMRILFLINKQMAQLLEIRELQAEGYPAPVIAEQTGQRDFIVRRSMALGKNFSLEELKENFEFGLEMDAAVKSGRIKDSAAVELMLCRFSMPA